jgi:hypothetical protein
LLPPSRTNWNSFQFLHLEPRGTDSSCSFPFAEI